MREYRYPRGYREDEEMYVYDQCCANCAMKSTLCIEKQIFLYNPGMYLEIAAERPVSIVEGARLLRLEEVVPATTEVSEHDKTICAALVMDSMVKGPC